MFADLLTASKRGYTATQKCLYMLACATHPKHVHNIRAIKGVDEVVVSISPNESRWYRYQYEKAVEFTVGMSAKDIADIRRSGDIPDVHASHWHA